MLLRVKKGLSFADLLIQNFSTNINLIIINAMANDNNFNQDQNQEQDPFSHPIRNNNWWLYIIGGLILAGIIIWFFIDWSYKDRDKEPIPVEQTVQTKAPIVDETLPTVTVTDTLPLN